MVPIELLEGGVDGGDEETGWGQIATVLRFTGSISGAKTSHVQSPVAPD